MQLEQAEARLKEQRSLANRLQMEKDQVQDKLEQCQREYHCQVREKGYILEKVLQPLRVFAVESAALEVVLFGKSESDVHGVSSPLCSVL